jgi:isoleucyl-tRNA synthetase
VLEADPELRFPADLYTEGGDQHRGWFHSSLLCSVATRDAAPYRYVATSGWTLDEQGRAMSKTLGNVVDPVDIAKRLGGEIVRLWVASVDFREDVAASENLMQRVADNYRKLRNTFRFLLGNLNGFDPDKDRVAFADLQPLDQYMLARTHELTSKVLRWYEEFEFHRVYQAINEFAVVDLSSLYLDALKDRMYTFAPTSVARRSAQTAMWRIAEALVRLVAPILSFTTEEVWGYLPALEKREASVHIAHFPKAEDLIEGDTASLLSDWQSILAIRDEALKVLEEARKEKRIGKALEASVAIEAPAEFYGLLKNYEASLKELFNVSQVYVKEGAELKAVALPAEGDKCDRCWNYRTDVSAYGAWPNVCGRCQGYLKEMDIEPPAAVEAKA